MFNNTKVIVVVMCSSQHKVHAREIYTIYVEPLPSELSKIKYIISLSFEEKFFDRIHLIKNKGKEKRKEGRKEGRKKRKGKKKEKKKEN